MTRRSFPSPRWAWAQRDSAAWRTVGICERCHVRRPWQRPECVYKSREVYRSDSMLRNCVSLKTFKRMVFNR